MAEPSRVAVRLPRVGILFSMSAGCQICHACSGVLPGIARYRICRCLFAGAEFVCLRASCRLNKIGLCGRCTRLADIVRRNLGGATESKLSKLSRNREQVGRERPDGVIVETAF